MEAADRGIANNNIDFIFVCFEAFIILQMNSMVGMQVLIANIGVLLAVVAMVTVVAVTGGDSGEGSGTY